MKHFNQLHRDTKIGFGLIAAAALLYIIGGLFVEMPPLFPLLVECNVDTAC